MSIPYRVLSIALAPAGTTLAWPGAEQPSRATSESPAVEAMTDLTRIPAATVEPDATLERAEEHMRYSRVRLLFVLDAQRGLLGLVTLNDLKGERPVRYQREMGVSHGDIRVRDIMTPLDRLETIPYAEVLDARIGDIIQTLKRSGRQHALVVERSVASYAIRGIFSATRISRQLGVPVETSGIAFTFAELEAALSH